MVNIKLVAKAVLDFCKKNSTKILAGVAIVSQGAGFYFMHKKAPIVNEKLKSLDKNATVMDKLKIVGPNYAIPFGLFLLSSGCIIGGVISGEKKIAIVNGLYTASQAALTKVEEEMVAKVGPEQAEEAQNKAVEAFLTDEKKPAIATKEQVFNTGYGTDLFKEPFSGRYFYSSRPAVENGIASFNREITGDMSASVNDLLAYWDLDPCELGTYVGWNVDDIYNDGGRCGLDVSFEAEMSPWNESCQAIKIHNKVKFWDGRNCRFR